MSGERPVLVAAGGTGGHVFPALAVIHELRARGRPVVLITDARGRRFLPRDLAQAGVDVCEVRAASPSGGASRMLKAGFELAAGTRQALAVVKRIRPAAAGLFGGYAAVPALAACVWHRVPLLLHEQNAVLGRANRLAARFARVLALSFADTERVPPRLSARVRVTGNPVRPGFAAAAAEGRSADGRLRLLVTGGSQGARVFGEVVPAALALLPEDLRRRIVLWMQTRGEQLEEVRAAVRALVAEAEVQPFFADLDRRLHAADLAITRAGASTVAELAAAAVPAILVPFPYAADSHQHANALRLARAGAAEVLDQDRLSPRTLAARLATLLADPAQLAAMREAARAFARPRAAADIADLLLSLAPETTP